MKKEWTVTIPNPLFHLLLRLRWRRAWKKWYKDLPWIREYMTRYPHFRNNTDWHWGQLVEQEWRMWVSLGQQVGQEELDSLCDRRGFNIRQRAYLIEMLKHIWLGHQLDDQYVPEDQR